MTAAEITKNSPTIQRTGKEKFAIWFHQNRFWVLGLLSGSFQFLFLYFMYFPPQAFNTDEDIYEEIQFVDNVKVKQPDVEVPAAEARSAGIEGMLVLELVIGEDGRVLRARVLKGLGHGLDQSAVQTYYSKRFTPAYKEGKPITVKINVPIRFQLI